MEGTCSILEAAHLLYYKLWCEGGLDKLLQPVPGHNGKYLPKEVVKSLQLQSLSYNESVLLIREEYELAFQYLQVEEGKKQQIRNSGVVITGQPGIGMCLSPAVISFANSHLILEHLIQGSPVSCTTCCFVSWASRRVLHFNWTSSSFYFRILVSKFQTPTLLVEGVCLMAYGPFLIPILSLNNHVMPSWLLAVHVMLGWSKPHLPQSQTGENGPSWKLQACIGWIVSP